MVASRGRSLLSNLAPIIAALCVLAGSAHAQESKLLREPTVSETQIAFSYANDIWVVSRSGGVATRLTTFPGTETNPHFSPDGSQVAFTGQYDGNVDVYVMFASGGEPQRLTWHPGSDVVRGWTADGSSVVFASGRETAPVPFPRLYTVSVNGGTPESLPLPRAFAGSFSPDGGTFAYQWIGRPNGQWRNYRGGMVQPVRLFDMESFEERQLPWTDSNDHDPHWLGSTVYFLSDRDWAVNLYAYDTTAGELRQVTHFADYDAKHLDAGGGVVVLEQGGVIHLHDPGTGETRVVPIEVKGDFPWLRPHWAEVGGQLRQAALSPSGARAIFEARGEIITVPAEKGDSRNLTESSGVADRSPAWSPDGANVSWFSDVSGEYQLMIASQDGLDAPRAIELPDPTFYYTPTWSPDSKSIAFTDADLNLWFADVASGRVTRVDTDQYAHPQRTMDPAWSPDSKWIAYAKRLDNQYHAVMVYSVDDNRVTQLTDGMSDAVSPAWDAGGKYLYFLASTDFGLSVGWLDMTSYDRPVERGIYLAVLAADEASPLLPESDEEEANGEAEDESGDDEEDSEAVAPVRIDFDGIDQRILAIDVPLRNYISLMAGEEGVLFYARASDEGNGFSLHRYSLEDREGEAFLDGITSANISADGKKVLYRGGESWGIVSTEKGEKKLGDGKIDTEVRVRVDPRAEWQQMFREAWRFQRDYLYVENAHGLDWNETWANYEPWLEHVAHRSDFTYLLSNLAGELSIGHSYTGGGDTPEVDVVSIGLLGADVEAVGDRFRISLIYDGENWNPDLRAPLSGPGIDVAVGDFLLAVNGRPITTSRNFFSYFEGMADRQITVTVNSSASMDGARQVTVVPVGSEVQLRRRAWVEGNRRRVDEMSGGRLAYVWLPNTSVAGYDYFNRYYFAQQDRDGAVVDERFNGGGSAADYMVDLMGRRLTGFFNNPIGERKPWRNPNAGVWGPKVMIINESAGSGGDLLPFMFRELGIGPLVGTRTWGGLVGIWDVPPLVDGGYITAPRGGFYNLAGEWAVENEGVAPDIEVEMTPSAVIAGGDPQLERAVDEALRLLETESVEILPEPAPPVRARRPE